jgi:hypothetical protein
MHATISHSDVVSLITQFYISYENSISFPKDFHSFNDTSANVTNKFAWM